MKAVVETGMITRIEIAVADLLKAAGFHPDSWETLDGTTHINVKLRCLNSRPTPVQLSFPATEVSAPSHAV
jgi:hypothetical protein